MPAGDPRLVVTTARAVKLLESYGITRPNEICLDDIAWALGIRISNGPLSGAEAHLVRVGGSGTIITSNTIAEAGRRRFAIAHELGHWEMHSSISQVFFCSEADMRKYEHSGPEIEANAFASGLLMPKSMVNASILKAEPNLEMIRRLSHDFDVTLTAAAVRYVCLSRQPVMVVLSNGERVRWWRKNEDRMANLWLESEQRLSTCSVAADLRKNPSSTGTLQPVAWSAWFPHIEDRGEEVFECSVRLFPYETILSLLWVPSRY